MMVQDSKHMYSFLLQEAQLTDKAAFGIPKAKES